MSLDYLAKRLGLQLTLKNMPYGAAFNAIPGGLPLDNGTASVK